MSCCSCHKTPCSCSPLLEEARPYRRVGSASFLLASDRNGNPVNLEKTSFGIPLYLNDGGVVVADGSKDHPIILPNLQELLDGQSVLIRNGMGIAGVISPTEDDTYLVFQGGVLGFSKVIPRDNAFDAGNISVQAGKLVTLACAIDGNMTLGLLSDVEGDYISLGADGVARVYNFCDAADTTELASIFGCYNGKIGKIKPSAGKVVKSNDNGTAWVVTGGGPDSTIVFTDITALSEGGGGKPTPFTKSFTLPSEIPESVTAILLDAELLIIKGNKSGALFKVTVNGWPLIGGFASGSFISPYDTNQKFIEYPTSRTLNFTSSISYDIPGTWSSWSITVKVRGYIP